MSKIKLILLVINLALIHAMDSSNVHYITPSLCTGQESCLTLSTLAANSSDYLDLNTTFIFLEGNHTLDSELVMSNISSSLMLSSYGSGTAAIICSGNASLKFSDITQLQISELEFTGCCIKVELVGHFILEDSRFHGGYNDLSIYLNHTNASIVQTSFTSNTAGTYQSHVAVLAYVRYNRYDFPYPNPNIQSTNARIGGALIVTNSTVIITSSHFENNTAEVGGAIFSQKGSNITITNCTFVKNSATGCSDDGCHGGALSIDSGCTVTVHNSTFMKNTAGYAGGAIALFQGTFFDSAHNVFSSNRAGELGGVISAYDRSSIIIDNSSYSNNTGTRYGGAIYTHEYGSITVGNSSFDNNVANNNGGVMFAYSRSIITVSNSSFYNNKAGSSGGVMCALYNSSITVGNSSFENNIAGNNEGVMYALYSCNITVGNSSFNKNKAGDNSGVMAAWYNSIITVGNSFFGNNQADEDGGVMAALYSSRITVGDSSFENNEAGDNDGVMYALDSSNITVGNSSFDNNEAGRDSGVMAAWYNSSITVGNSSFDNNVAGNNGGVIYAYSSSSIAVSNSSFDNNVAGNDGGVMYAYSSSSITVGNSSFDNNIAGYDGGVMYAYSSSSITVGNSSFDNNVADNDGGVMSAWFGNSITVGNSSFYSNTAGHDGGVAHAYYGYSGEIKINFCTCTFLNNSASEGGVVYVRDGYFTDLGSMYYGNMASNGGVIILNEGVVEVTDSKFVNNTGANRGGVLYTPLHRYAHVIKLESSSFINNSAISGGAIALLFSATVTVAESNFAYNNAIRGGAIYVMISNILTANGTIFSHNSAYRDGGMIYSEKQNRMRFKNCEIMFNRADSNGGVFCLLFHSELNITGDSSFIGNQAHSGGVVYAIQSATIIRSQILLMANNSAVETGGAVYLAVATFTSFSGNHVLEGNQAHSGGVVYAIESSVHVYSQSLLIANNFARGTGGAVHISKTNLSFFGGNNRFVQNKVHSAGGALYASESKIEAFSESLLLINNTARDNGGAMYLFKANLSFIKGSSMFGKNKAIFGGALYLNKGQLIFSGGDSTLIGNKANDRGGAIHLNEGQLIFSGGNSTLVNNEADDGGAIYASESKLIIEKGSQTNVDANLAVHCGGGLYLAESELKIKGENSHITKNIANDKGGGIHASSSSIIVAGAVYFISNEAQNGGGVSLEKSSKLHGTLAGNDHINLARNRASHYGGALYVDDKTNSDLCAAVNTSIGCFSESVFINASDNFAGISGSNLFGGLLDRCTVHNELSKEHATNTSGIVSFQNSTNINKSQLYTITSHPTQLCFCRGGQPDCNYQPEPIHVNRGHLFSVELIAYDQIHHAVNASIQCSRNSSAGGLGVGQQTQNIKRTCTMLEYKLFSPNNYENLTFSAIQGPCSNISGISKRSIVIKIVCSCPIGFQESSNNNETLCDCICDEALQPYKKTECNSVSESIIRNDNFWISYINHTLSNSSGYVLIYPHCPFDYCCTPSKSVSINLNLPNGSDAQCDSNRMGTLCGTCKPGFSVSLGSSKCVLCPAYWPGLLVIITIVFILSGIGLVAFLLVLNLTVAIGTLNAVVFYANIVAANKSALFPSGVSLSPASVFISWLNFDLGFDVCFFDGMNTYAKVWLQLAFPAYIIILVVVIIQLSYYFSAFGHLIGKKDPVATLATMILLSYTKLLQTIIIAFSSATLSYPDGSKKTLWLPDATLEYFTSKHAVLFFIAILILLAGLVYTSLLFSWQWFLWCPRKRVKWIRNQKLSSFIEIYLVPYTPKYRYWTGLLLLVRVIVYLVSAFNPTGDPRIILSTTNFIMSSLFLYIATFGVRMYKNRFINTMETFTYFNIIALSIFTSYTIDADTNQTAITNVSVGITFIQLIAVILYHAYKHLNQKLFTMIQGSAICIKMKEKLIPQKQKQVNNHNQVPIDEDIHQFHILLDMIDRPANTNDYIIPQVQPKPIEPTQSVVEIPKPIQPAPATPSPPPLEAIKEEPESEYQPQQQEESEQDGINMAENQVTEINKNKQCINKCPGIEILECDGTSCVNPENGIKHSCTMLQENLIPKPRSNSQINSYSDIKQPIEEAMEMTQLKEKGQSSQDVPLFPADSGHQEGCGAHCIIVEAEIHDC